MQASRHWTPPAEFDEYRLVRPLGRGAMGQVYLAHDTLLDRPVAIKLIASGEAHDLARERFAVEARAIARLQHPNVVAIYRIGEVEGFPYLVSEFVRGQPLAELPRPIPGDQALGIGLGLARGLAAAHRCGVLHRDIKPANAILSREGEPKLLDFGLAKLLEASVSYEDAAPTPATSEGLAFTITHTTPRPHAVAALDATAPRADAPRPAAPARQTLPHSDANSALTDAGSILGTPLYMAPEIWRGEPATRGSDIYSLGALLYELCSGCAPHREATLSELGRVVKERDALPLCERAPHVDARLGSIVDRCLRRDPRDRFTSAEEICYTLEQLTPALRAIVPEGNPYRGLHAFDAQHRALFCGRGLEIRAVIERLRAGPLVIVAGESGVGKSSLCRAGVLPLLTEEGIGEGRSWSFVSLIPGRRPLEALAEALARPLGQATEECLSLLGGEMDLGRVLRRRQGEQQGVVIFIDQMEELLTQSDAQEATCCAEILGRLSAHTPGVRVLGTVRGDFLTRLAELPGLGGELSSALYILRPLSAAGLREAIIEPARRTGARFESEAMVDELVETTARAPGGLPLLQFALGELWEVRDARRQVIPAAALSAIGGVSGALARHADGVLTGLLPAQRTGARRILTKLVTRDGTRARRPEAELLGPDGEHATARETLAALVRGRLLVAHEGEDEAVYEVAHEALIQGWSTLRDWLSTSRERRAVVERVEAAALEWERLGRIRDALWSGRQLAEAMGIGLEEAALAPRELEFLSASRRDAVRRRRVRIGIALAVPAVLSLVYSGFALRARMQIKRAVAIDVGDAQSALRTAREQDAEVERRRQRAFASFDAGNTEEGEQRWGSALELTEGVYVSYAAASRALERALTLDRVRRDVRQRLAEVLYEQAVLAERDHRKSQSDDLIQRAANYDEKGEMLRRWQAPADLSLATTPPGAQLTIQRYEDRQGYLRLTEARALGRTPLQNVELVPGSYLLTLTLPGISSVRYPLLLSRAERFSATVHLPSYGAIPPGFVYIPDGRFLYGSADEESMRRDLMRAQPLHQVKLHGYLISRTEVTYGDWIQFLRAQPPSERARHRPHSGGRLGASDRGVLDLIQLPDESWRLHLQPTNTPFLARSGEPLRYPGRDRRQLQDWMQLPVTGVTWENAQAYAGWLHRSGRLPGARICDEREWERAARGADDRLYPHGQRLAGDEANIDETYGRHPLAFGPDEVGSHPASDSPFGVADLAGNVWEWARSVVTSPRIVQRGGGFYHEKVASRSNNREPGEETLREIHIGIRLCADL